MTLRISAVAVCRSSASCVSLNSRAFWIAITAWSAKVLSSAICLSGTVARCAGSKIDTDRGLPRISGTASRVRTPIARYSWRSGYWSSTGIDERRIEVTVHGARSASLISARRCRPRAVASPTRDGGAVAERSIAARPRCQMQIESRRRAPPRRAALAAIVSNTGCTVGRELLITRSISAVAVCCSSASCVSLNSRTFSIAITAWSAKVCSSSICCRSKRRAAATTSRSRRLPRPRASRAPRRSSGTTTRGACDLKKTSLPGARLSATCTARPSTTARPAMLCRSIGTTPARETRRPLLRSCARGAAGHRRRSCAARSCGRTAARAVHDGVEHRLHVRRRAGDDLQDLGRGGLSVQRGLGLRQVLGLRRHLRFAGFVELTMNGLGCACP